MTKGFFVVTLLAALACSGCALPTLPAFITGNTTIASQDELTEIVHKANFDAQPSEMGSGRLPHFTALTSADAAPLGLPGALIIDYVLRPDKKGVIFWGEIRPLRADEIGVHTNEKPGFAYAPELVARLQAANPDPQHSTFLTYKLPLLQPNGQYTDQPALVLDVQLENKNIKPEEVTHVKKEMVDVLTATGKLWQ